MQEEHDAGAAFVVVLFSKQSRERFRNHVSV